MFLLVYMIMLVCVLVSVAFITLMERKVLGYIQLRKGPNSVGLTGILQPFSDGIKLFFKEQSFPLLSNFFVYFFTPVFMLMISFLLWSLFPYLINLYTFNMGFLFFLCCTGIGVYGVMLVGWSSSSIYGMLGGLRSVAQTISYEVSMALILICFMVFVFSFNFLDFMKYQSYVWFIYFCFPLFLSWFMSCLAETNRSPFDFSEGESELVSGFNVEYSSGGFAFIFLSEYMNILFMSLLTCIFFLGCNLFSFTFFMSVVFVGFMFIWVRGTLPRFRYDKLMYVAWKVFLPLSLNYLLFFSFMLLWSIF